MKALATSFFLLMFCASVVGQNSDSDKSKILALENAWNLAEQHKDVKALNELLGENLVYIDYDGTIQNKTQFLTAVSKPSLHPEQIVNESTTVFVYNNAAVVTGVYREKGMDGGKPYSRHGRFTDTWVFDHGSWQCVASQSTLMGR
jgi:ketosteroid isomerase-like protein